MEEQYEEMKMIIDGLIKDNRQSSYA